MKAEFGNDELAAMEKQKKPTLSESAFGCGVGLEPTTFRTTI